MRLLTRNILECMHTAMAKMGILTDVSSDNGIWISAFISCTHRNMGNPLIFIQMYALLQSVYLLDLKIGMLMII